MALRRSRAHQLFPVLALGLMAALTSWLERISQPQAEDEAEAASNAPDMRVEQFTLKRFDPAGTQQYIFSAATMHHYASPERTELERPELLFLGRPEPVRATAQRGTVSPNGESVRLVGEVTVTREATGTRGEATLRTEALTVWPETERVVGEMPVRYTDGPNAVHAGRFVAENLDQTLQLGGGVTATFLAQ